MSTFKVTSIDVDKNPCKLAENNLQFNQLKGQVSNYLNYMEVKTGLSQSAITCSMTLDRTLISELLNDNQGAEGIRIYLIKKSSDVSTQTDVSFLALSVKTATDGPNQGRLVEMTPIETTAPERIVPEITMALSPMAVVTADSQPLLAFKADCPTGACPPATAMKSNHTLLP